MTRRPLPTALATVLAAALVPVVTGPLAGTAPRAAAAPDDESPLAVSLETMTPSVVPRRGSLTLSGEVTNTSEETWTDLQAYLFTSATPLTTREELAEAAATEPATEVGGRLTTPGLFEEIGDLDPGESTSYTISVARKDLGISGEPGVYWTGVHVLGAVDGVRPGVAAGRARTFVPLMGAGADPAEVAVVLPLRQRVRRSSDGRLLGEKGWQQTFGTDGRLGRLAGFASESDGPLTWVMDPAVLDAASAVARDNPPLSTSDDGTGPDPDEGEEEPGSSASASPDAPAPEDPEAADGEESIVELTEPAQEASDWLEELVASSAGATVLGLPYGDVDVAAVTTNRLGQILRTARRLSRDTLTAHGIAGSSVVAPPSGLLPRRALAGVNPDDPVVLADRAFPDMDGPVLVRPDETEVVLLDSAVAQGGPGPNDRTDPLALRQRLLADAALQSLSGQSDEPIVFSLPQDYDPGGSWEGADFFDGLEVPWLRQVDLAGMLAAEDAARVEGPPSYPGRQRRRHIPFANQLATQELVRTGEVYAELLTRNDSVRADLAKSAMLASSYAARRHPDAALERVRNTTLRVRRTMQLVGIDGPSFVMMSSETGSIDVSVVNNLDEPVTVVLEARTPRNDLTINAPDPITLEPGERTPVRMRAESKSIAVHEVTLVATTEAGQPLGSEAQFNVRTSNVGFVIWLVMGAGGAVLLGMIVFRIVRRVRARRTQTVPEAAA